MDNQAYLRKFQANIDVIDTVGGWVGLHPTLAEAVLTDTMGITDVATATPDQKREARNAAREEYLACRCAADGCR